MNQIHRLATLLLGFLFAAFALPSVAATGTKYFWAEFDQTVSPAMKVNVVFNNATPPPGVSTINSLRIQMVGAPGGITITGVRMTAQNGSPITPIVLPFSPNPGTDIVVNNFPGIKNNKNATFELQLAGTLPDNCSAITWAAYANTGNAYPQGDEFVQGTTPSKLLTGIACAGILGCDASNRTAGTLVPGVGNQVTYSGGADQGKWSIIRGNNYNTNSCVVVPYTFEVSTTPPVQVSKFIVPDVNITGQAVAVKYTVVWGRFDANADLSNMFLAKRPKLSWGIANPQVASLDYVPALPCVLDPDSPDFSGTGKLFPNGFVSVSTTDLDRLLPLIPNAEPFNTIPVDDLRHQHYRYEAGINKKARMCVTQQGWTAVGTDYALDPLNVSLPFSPIMFQEWTTVIDQGDGYVSRDL